MRWTLTGGLPDDFQFPISPVGGGTFGFARNVTKKRTTVGNLIGFVGSAMLPECDITGVVLDRRHYEQMLAWNDQPHQVLVTTDLGVARWVYITNLKMEPAPRHRHPWRHSYSATLTEVNKP